MEQGIKFLPFALSGLSLPTLAFAYFRPTPSSINFMRWSMIVIGLCSFTVFFEHISNYLSFWKEIRPNSTSWEFVVATFNGGISILVPGILLLGAVIGLAAIYRHPLLEMK